MSWTKSSINYDRLDIKKQIVAHLTTTVRKPKHVEMLKIY